MVRPTPRQLAVAASFLLAIALVLLAAGGRAPLETSEVASRARTTTPEVPPTTEAADVSAEPTASPAAPAVAPTDAPAAAPAPQPATAPATPSPAAPVTAPVSPAPWSIGVHAGFGVWVDVFDWSLSHSNGAPAVTLETVDRLAAEGVQTVYLQTARVTAPDAVLEPVLLQALIDRMHDHGMFVVAWYLPTFVDVDDDWRRVEAALALDVDGFALDIESQEVEDVAERNRRYLELSRRLRAAAGDRALVANVLPPVPLEDLNTATWPDFPWVETAELYDVFMPMAYFTFRTPGNGEQWRDAETYTAENIRRIRANTGDPDVPVHLIGGIADRTTPADVAGMTRAAIAEGAIGLSLYDVATTGDELWAPMRAWRELGR